MYIVFLGQLVNDVRSWWNDDRNENERQILKAVLLSDKLNLPNRFANYLSN